MLSIEDLNESCKLVIGLLFNFDQKRQSIIQNKKLMRM